MVYQTGFSIFTKRTLLMWMWWSDFVYHRFVWEPAFPDTEVSNSPSLWPQRCLWSNLDCNTWLQWCALRTIIIIISVTITIMMMMMTILKSRHHDWSNIFWHQFLRPATGITTEVSASGDLRTWEVRLEKLPQRESGGGRFVPLAT